ncbi:MAG: ATP synthase F1 subunit delta [Syntrophales bacterium]|nr:ATP synthase F1 subunit delta [Syntrophales bacterium]
MTGNTVAKRYAQAFFEIAEEEKKLEDYYTELHSICNLIEGSNELKGFLANPIVEQKDKKKIIETILEKVKPSPITANFIRLLTDKQRIVIFKDIVDAYREKMDEALGILRVQVKTAFPLTPEWEEKLRKHLMQSTGKRVLMDVVEDKALLGGLVVKIGDLVYDNSIKTQLNNIRNLLGEEK